MASSSPRRRELLAQLGVSFDVIHPMVDERVRSGESPQQYVVRVALEKARAGWESLGSQNKVLRPVIGAELPIDRAAEAHQLLTSGDVIGKVVLLIG